MQNLKSLRNCASFLLALFPILISYVSSISLNYGEIAMLFFFITSIFISKSFRVLEYPSGYYVFWAVVAVLLIVNSSGFKITYLIPGGISFMIFSLSLGVVNVFIDFHKFYKYLKFLAFLSIIIQIIQLLHLLPPQYSASFILPISPHIGYDLSLSELNDLRLTSTRPCSFFLEPAYYAEYLLIFLAVELFKESNRNKIFTPMSIVVILSIILLSSGLGVVCLAVLLVVKVIDYFTKSKASKVKLLLLIPIMFFAVGYYLQSESGESIVSRTEELDREGSSGFLRVFQGLYIYQELPLRNKILGTNMDSVEKMNLSFIKYNSEGDADLFTNGLFTLLIKTGLIGALLLFYIFFKIFKSGNKLSKVIIILLLAMSLIEQVYITSSMLLCMVIAYQGLKHNNNEDSLLITNRPV